jgi:hypothetical protein
MPTTKQILTNYHLHCAVWHALSGSAHFTFVIPFHLLCRLKITLNLKFLNLILEFCLSNLVVPLIRLLRCWARSLLLTALAEVRTRRNVTRWEDPSGSAGKQKLACLTNENEFLTMFLTFICKVMNFQTLFWCKINVFAWKVLYIFSYVNDK